MFAAMCMLQIDTHAHERFHWAKLDLAHYPLALLQRMSPKTPLLNYPLEYFLHRQEYTHPNNLQAQQRLVPIKLSSSYATPPGIVKLKLLLAFVM
jgi:hypothetical protein